MKNTSKKLQMLARGKRRQALVESGAYDGRYKPKTIPDKRNKQPRHKPNYNHGD